MRDQIASIIALSYESLTEPVEGTSPDWRALGERRGSELAAVVRVDHCPTTLGAALLDHHCERVGCECGGRAMVDRPADDAAAVGVEHEGAVHLAFPARLLADTGNPQLIWPVSARLPINEVVRARQARHAPSFRCSGAARDAARRPKIATAL